MINSDIKSPTATSYSSVVDADTYFETNIFGAAWTDLTTAKKESYLVFATNRLDMEKFSGIKTDSMQALEMPRKTVVARDGLSYLDPDTLPREFKQAFYELIIEYIKEYELESPTVSKNDQERMSDSTIGPIKSTLRKTSEYSMPDIVKRHLRSVGSNFWVTNVPFFNVVRV